MNVTIICVGKLKEKFFKEATDEYIKRISRFAKVNVLELSDEAIPANASPAEEKNVLFREGEKILAKIPKGAFVISLCIEGKELSSTQMSRFLEEKLGEGVSNICFIIGGSLGLSDEVKNRSDFKLSFSKMTFPHQLMRVVLLEQVYRCFKISANESYHK